MRRWISGSSLLVAGATVLATVGLVAAVAVGRAAGAPPHDRHWVTAWATAIEPAASAGVSEIGFADQTVRMIVHTTAGGDTVRIRLSNAFGTGPLDIGAVDIAARAAGAATVPGTDRALSFTGRPTVTLPAGAEAVSDPVGLPVAADSDLVISVYLPDHTGPTSWHGWARQTSYLSAPGDHAADPAATAFPTPVTSWFFLRNVDVASTTAAGTVAAFGDSITEGWKAPIDANQRWTDDLARRMAGPQDGRGLSVANEGIGGNRVLTDGPANASNGTINFGPSGEARFARDTLGLTGLRAVIVYEGINDIGGMFGVHPGQSLTTDQLIAGLADLASAAHAGGVRVFAATITPKGGLTPEEETIREQVNAWLRGSRVFDGVFDFDAALRDPANPAQLLPAYDSGDHLHPNAAGQQRLADAVDIRALTGDR